MNVCVTADSLSPRTQGQNPEAAGGDAECAAKGECGLRPATDPYPHAQVRVEGLPCHRGGRQSHPLVYAGIPHRDTGSAGRPGSEYNSSSGFLASNLLIISFMMRENKHRLVFLHKAHRDTKTRDKYTVLSLCMGFLLLFLFFSSF